MNKWQQVSKNKAIIEETEHVHRQNGGRRGFEVPLRKELH